MLFCSCTIIVLPALSGISYVYLCVYIRLSSMNTNNVVTPTVSVLLLFYFILLYFQSYVFFQRCAERYGSGQEGGVTFWLNNLSIVISA